MYSIECTVLCLIYLSSCVTCLESARILLIPAPVKGSPAVIMKAISEELLKQGHKPHILIKSTDRTEVPHGVGKITYQTVPNQLDSKEFQQLLFTSEKGILEIASMVVKTADTEAGHYLGDREMFAQVEALKFDLVIVDGIFLFSWLALLPYKLKIPYIMSSPKFEPWLYGVPTLPSVMPHQITTFTAEMTFTERLELPPVTGKQLMMNASIWLLIHDPLLDYGHLSSPNMALVGGVTATEPKLLPPDMERFMASADDGVIVVSLGAVLKSLSEELMVKLFEALNDSRIKQKIIWKYTGKALQNVPAKMKLMDWLPQNDLLGHKKTRLFVAHCGNNGQQEMVYHGVPCLCLPMGTDMNHNAVRMKSKGYGIFLNFYSHSSKEISDGIVEVLSNRKYADQVKKASRIIHSRPMNGRQTVVYWVNHILEFGSEHLRTHAITMPWYKFFMVDVLLFHIVLTVLCVLFVKALMCWFCRKCARTTKLKHN